MADNKIRSIIESVLKILGGIMRIASAGVVFTKAAGRFANNIIASWGPKILYVRKRYTERHTTKKQGAVREVFKKVDLFWIQMGKADRETWRSVAAGKGRSNYAQFMSVNLTRVHEGKPIIRNPK